jgi:hypothetical protein
MIKLWNKIRCRLGLYNLRSLVEKKASNEFDDETVAEMMRCYDGINKGEILPMDVVIAIIHFVEATKEDFINGKIK